MAEFLVQMIEQYGLIAVLIGTALDHTGTPGAMLLSIGIATTDAMDITSVLIVSIIGGLLGDVMLYTVGYYGGKRALNYFSKRNEGIRESKEKLQSWIEKFGPQIIIWGRFVAVIGRYLSLIYGSFAYSFIRFTLLSLIGGIIMVLSFGLPTFFIGNHLNELFENPLFTVYVTFGITIAQIIFTWAWFKIKHLKQNNAK